MDVTEILMSARTGSSLKALPVENVALALVPAEAASKKLAARAALAKTIGEIQNRNRDLSKAEAQALVGEAMASLDQKRYADRSWANAG